EAAARRAGSASELTALRRPPPGGRRSKDRGRSPVLPNVRRELAEPSIEVTRRPEEIRVRATALRKVFTRTSGELVKAVDDVSLTVGAGKMLILLGPSGCGKTT